MNSWDRLFHSLTFSFAVSIDVKIIWSLTVLALIAESVTDETYLPASVDCSRFNPVLLANSF